MSNPGVIILSARSSSATRYRRFQIEDNIGESIHLHLDDMRFDFTVSEFLNFSDKLKECLSDPLILNNPELIKFDPHFLSGISNLIPNILCIKNELIKLTDLRCIVRKRWRGFEWLSICQAAKTPAYKYLNGDKSELISYSQFNYAGISNEEKLNVLFKSIAENGFDETLSSVVLIGSKNIVRDGQHRIAILTHLLGGEVQIPIKRIILSRGNANLNIFSFNLRSIFKRTATFIISFAKRMLRKTLNK
jgi:hypothetical protein